MQIDFQRILNYLLMALAVCCGIVVGILAGRLIDLFLGGESVSFLEPLSKPVVVRPLQEDDFQIILSRNLFSSAAVGAATEQIDLSTTPMKVAIPVEQTTIGAELRLIGTVVAGEKSLALIQAGKKAGIFQLGEEPVPGVAIVDIKRKMVVLMERGKTRELPLKQQNGAKPRLIGNKGNVVNVKDGIVPLTEGRWRISKAVAENARANLNSLLQTARVVPEVKKGRTIGFKLVEVQNDSLLAKIGLRVGDLIVEINQVELNSPEKALQIFQQLREANNISIGLIRNGQPETFEYRLE